MTIPAWAPIQFDFDQQAVLKELNSNRVFSKAKISTVIYEPGGQSIWDKESTFTKEEKFSKFSLAPHYVLNEFRQKKIVPGKIDTFKTINLTHLIDRPHSTTDGWEGELESNDRTPLWIKFRTPWIWRDDLDLKITKEVVQSLPFEYFLAVRCILQKAPSIGIAHVDSSRSMNQQFFQDGFGSLTLNVSSGGANLNYLDPFTGNIKVVDEQNFKCWHFDDSSLHCTDEVISERIQIRVFGKLKKSYAELLNGGNTI